MGTKPPNHSHVELLTSGIHCTAMTSKRYLPSKKGTFAKGVTPEIELVPLKLSPYAYGDVRNLINDETEGETIFSFDLIMEMESEQVVQGYNWKRSTTAPKS